MPEDIKKEIFELSRLNAIDLNKLAQMKAAKAMEKAAENESGTAGAGMGMGMGFAMANQMGQSFASGQQQSNALQPKSSTPPPIPTAVTFFAVINGQQAGPFDINTLKNMVSQKQITKEVLVWKEGMASWIKAGQVTELNSIFGSTPPPIPGT